MAKPDESAFYAALRRFGSHPNVEGWKVALSETGMNDKRAHYLANKWAGRGWWDSGVTLRSGWFTDSAPQSLAEEK